MMDDDYALNNNDGISPEFNKTKQKSADFHINKKKSISSSVKSNQFFRRYHHIV